MARSAAIADGGIAITAVVARRKADGKLVLLESIERKSESRIVEHELDESADHALNLYGRLRVVAQFEMTRYSTGRSVSVDR